MNKTKKIVSVSLASCLLLTGMQAPLAAELLEAEAEVLSSVEKAVDQYIVTSKEIKEETEQVQIEITIPIFQGLADADYESKLNETISKQAQQIKEEIENMAKAGAEEAQKYEYEFRQYQNKTYYELKTAGNIISVIVTTYTYTGGANGFESKEYYTFVNEAHTQTLQLSDLFIEGTDYITLVNKAIKEAIAEQENGEEGTIFFEGEMGFQTINDDQDFYLENGELVIAFGKYEIAPGAMGLPEFRFPLTQFAEILNPDVVGDVIEENTDVVSTDTESIDTEVHPEVDQDLAEEGKQMVSLREMGTQLGYTITWNEATKTAEMFKGAIWTSVKVGEDRYHFGKMAPQSLGKAAELREGRLFVPKAFFTDVLGEALTE